MSNPKRGQLFLNFEDENQKVIKPTYAKGGSWLPSIGFTNSLCTCFTRMTTGHAPIGEYRQRFLPHLPISCPCSKAEVQTREHIVMECDTYDLSTRPCNIIINSFVYFLADNPSAFSFDNSWDIIAVRLPWVKAQHFLFLSYYFSFFLYLSRYFVLATVCHCAPCNKLMI